MSCPASCFLNRSVHCAGFNPFELCWTISTRTWGCVSAIRRSAAGMSASATDWTGLLGRGLLRGFDLQQPGMGEGGINRLLARVTERRHRQTFSSSRRPAAFSKS